MDALENAVNVLAEKSKSIGYITDDDIMETIDACNVPTMKIEKLMELLLSANVHIEENTYDGNENKNPDLYLQKDKMNKSKKAETRKWIKNVIERKHRYEEEQKRLFSESGAVIKDKFFNDYEKARCQSTYMSVTMLAFLENADETGLADFSKIIRYFSEFYASRRANNNIIERSDSIFAKEVPDYQKIRRLILFNPLGRSCLVKYLIYDKSSDTLSINNNLWGVLTAADIIRLKKISYEKINRYYDLLSK